MPELNLIKVDLSSVSEVANNFLNKISSAVGALYEPRQIRLLAHAEADAEIIKTHGKIDAEALQQRAARRWIAEESRYQINMESVVSKTIPMLTAAADPSKMENDWISKFFEECRSVSDEEMQSLWARLLAGEANGPGTFSKRSIKLIGEMDKADAELFNKVCCFSVNIESGKGSMPKLIIFDHHSPIYKENGIDFTSLSHLSDVGLIDFNPVIDFNQTGNFSTMFVSYFGEITMLIYKDGQTNTFSHGSAKFTRCGEELARITNPKPIPGFKDLILNAWKGQGAKLLPIDEFKRRPEGGIEWKTSHPFPE